MCGILFYWNQAGVSPNILYEKSLGHMANRGPDFCDLYYGKDYVIGHTRLSIIDLTSSANQPFWDSTGRYVIVLNGEIYNYRELRQQLSACGHRFRTESDTEVLLAFIISFGLEKTLDCVRGMFAFVLYDNIVQKATIVRDHFGQKPLYYFFKSGCFAVASDIRSLTELQSSTTPNLAAYTVYLSTAGSQGTRGTFHTDRTFFDGINILPAGHSLTLEQGHISIEEYFTVWSLYNREDADDYADMSMASCLDELKSLLRQAVVRHLTSDVKVGVLTSGGIDSTLVYWFAQQQNPEITGFTKISPGIEEIPLDVIPNVLKQRPANVYFSLQKPEEYLIGLNNFIAASGAPSRWGGGPPMSKLCRDARRNDVYVLLGGDCADEYFSGYTHYENMFAHPQPDMFDLGDLVSLDSQSPFYKKEHAEDHQSVQCDIRRRILSHLQNIVDPCERYILATMFHDTSTFLQTCNLPHSDAYSMMESVELRNPLLDMDLVRFVCHLPPRFKSARHSSGHFGKLLLRELAAREIGEFVNRGKEGTRNYSMAWAHPSFWNFDHFAIQDVVHIPDELSKRDVIRLMNLEIFHRLFFLHEDNFFPKIMTPNGLSMASCGVSDFSLQSSKGIS
ncbi:MAG: asparagine synthase (glutamine-hydrolyzing) [Nitrospirales bacterium]|nr:asparagine synthase (glutamine-hydrolyzing) [Nitrospira sp.]MDR4503133.1 asparagine synthase (glutamine-hydrolyzing) [Nitrospirales bacterium]